MTALTMSSMPRCHFRRLSVFFYVPAGWFAAQIPTATAVAAQKANFTSGEVKLVRQCFVIEFGHVRMKRMHFQNGRLNPKVRIASYKFVSCLGDPGMVEKRTSFAGLS